MNGQLLTKKWRLIGLGLVVVLLVIGFLPLPSNKSAQVVMTPLATTVTKGTTWTSVISVHTTAKVNAIDLTVTFPADILDAVDVSTDNSDFGVTVFKPRIDNQHGAIRFVQAVPQGYVGSQGHVATVTFKANQAGSVRLGVGTATIVAADGKATNIYQPQPITTIGQLVWARTKDLWL